MICKILSIYLTLRYGMSHLFETGHYIMGHDFKYTDAVHDDHWEMECSRCHQQACTEISPQTVENWNKKSKKHLN